MLLSNERGWCKTYWLLWRQQPAETPSSERWLLPRSKLCRKFEALPLKSHRSCGAQRTRATWSQVPEDFVTQEQAVVWAPPLSIGTYSSTFVSSSFLSCMLNYIQNGNPTLQGSHKLLFFFPNNIGLSTGIRICDSLPFYSPLMTYWLIKLLDLLVM